MLPAYRCMVCTRRFGPGKHAVNCIAFPGCGILYNEQGSTAMNGALVWFERRFEFTFPVELHPNLCARLRGTPARLEETLRDRPHEILLRKAQEKWSPQEHA